MNFLVFVSLISNYLYYSTLIIFTLTDKEKNLCLNLSHNKTCSEFRILELLSGSILTSR